MERENRVPHCAALYEAAVHGIESRCCILALLMIGFVPLSSSPYMRTVRSREFDVKKLVFMIRSWVAPMRPMSVCSFESADLQLGMALPERIGGGSKCGVVLREGGQHCLAAVHGGELKGGRERKRKDRGQGTISMVMTIDWQVSVKSESLRAYSCRSSPMYLSCPLGHHQQAQ